MAKKKKNKKKKQKGFSLVELLAVIAILGILSGLAIGAYSRYKDKARQEAYDTLVKSSISAAESYLMDHPGTTDVNFDTLVNNQYLENSKDAYDNASDCVGTVRMTPDTNTEDDQLVKNKFIVDVCCANGNYQYDSNGRKVQTTMCQADFNEEKYIEHETSQCGSGKTKSKKFSIYTMEYLNRVCTKANNGRYGGCYDGSNPYGNTNFPCRRYQYYQYSCQCVYSKANNKYCSYSIPSSSSHIMRIKYLENANGHAACESDTPSSFNSYVHDVCWEGRYSGNSTVMTFHGYQFFKGQSTGYTDFRPEGTWFHDNITGISLEDRIQRKNDKLDAAGKVVPNPDQGCRDTCVRFTEAISKLAK